MSETEGGRRVTKTSDERKLRYRTLLEDLSTLEDEDDNNYTRMDKTADALKEAKLLLNEGGIEQKVKHPGEGYLDSRVLRATSDLSIRCAEAVSGNVNTYDKHELAQYIKVNTAFWFFAFPKEVPSALSLFGTFAPTPPEQRSRTVRRCVERRQAARLTAPETVDRLDKVEEGSEMVTLVSDFISTMYHNKGDKPLSYFHLVLDPESFSRTVENIYYVSFLVRDGMIAINLDEESELPMITPVPPTQPAERDDNVENQFIVSIDMQRWKELIEAFKIQMPMMVLDRQ